MTTPELLAPSPNGTATKAISPLLAALIGALQVEFQHKINDAVKLALSEAALPVGTRLDLDRMVWVLPPAPPAVLAPEP